MEIPTRWSILQVLLKVFTKERYQAIKELRVVSVKETTPEIMAS
jgi:hypothetical protein